jgi:3-oxoacyl-[acyl-carrier protein] reductase
VIINMSWDRVLQGMEGENPELFSAVKGGILSFSRSLARSLAPAVRVNVLAPGWIETAFGVGVLPTFKRQIAEKIPLGRWGTPEDVAGAAVYLASDAAHYVTGQMIMVNGGDVM